MSEENKMELPGLDLLEAELERERYKRDMEECSGVRHFLWSWLRLPQY